MSSGAAAASGCTSNLQVTKIIFEMALVRRRLPGFPLRIRSNRLYALTCAHRGW